MSMFLFCIFFKFLFVKKINSIRISVITLVEEIQTSKYSKISLNEIAIFPLIDLRNLVYTPRRFKIIACNEYIDG